MEIIPVIDLMGGRVVHAKGGLRDFYEPIKSVLTCATDLTSVVADLNIFFPFNTVYIADLDAILGKELVLEQYQQLVADFPNISFWLDAGIREEKDLARLFDIEGIRPVLASETLHDVTLLPGDGETILSLDFRQGQFLGDQNLWEDEKLWPHQVILMQLDYVGTRQGPDIRLFNKIMDKNKGVKVVMAGGVRGGKDLELLKEAGVAKVLVASALHDGGLSRAMLEKITKKALPFDVKGSAFNLSKLS